MLAITTNSSSAPAAPARTIAASFIHPIASLDDPLATAPAIPLPPISASRAQIATQNDEDDWMNYFPHNFDWNRIGSGYTREQLVEYFHPDHYDAIGIEDGGEPEKRELAAKFRDAAGRGWDAAATLDEGPRIEDEDETDEDAPQDEEAKRKGESSKKQRKELLKKESDKVNKAWDKFLSEFELPLVKAAAKTGYLARKKIDCIKEGKKFFVCGHGDGPGSGCLTNQYSSDRVRSAISNYFGRNKKQTKQIPNMMKWCRKHYQQDGYKDDIWQKAKRRHILKQLEQNEADVQKDGHKGLTYEIRLRAKDDKRLREFHSQKGNKGEPEASDKHPADLDVLQHIYDNYCDPSKTKEECKQLVDWAMEKFKEKADKWCEGKDQKYINKHFKNDGPKFIEFEMLPEYKRFYSKKELDAREARGTKTPKKTSNTATPSSKQMPKRSRKDRNDGSEDEQDESPIKKGRK
jgi:hypothetical protein